MKRIIFTLTVILVCITICDAQTRAKVTGTITDCETGDPLEGVAISAGELDPINTDVDGNFTLNISNGTYDLLLEKEDYYSLLMIQANLNGLMTLDTCLSMDNPSTGYLNVIPNEIFKCVLPEGSISEAITLTNDGSSAVSWNSIVEYEYGADYDWLSSLDQMNGTILPGETMLLYFIMNGENLPHQGVYNATVYFYYGGGNFATELSVSIYYGWQSIDEITDNVYLEISPNPTDGIINIESFGEKSHYYIYNFEGKIVMKGELTRNSNSVAINAFPSGTYILKVEDEKNNVSVGKFVKN